MWPVNTAPGSRLTAEDTCRDRHPYGQLCRTPRFRRTPILLAQIGNPHFKNEGLTAYEIGYRASIFKQLSIDAAAYYNDYDKQQTTEPAAAFLEPSPLPVHLVVPTTFENLMQGETHGLEIAANWKITDRWTISPGYDFERIYAR
jgi:iron complex outermembrane receptor protein